MSFFDECVDLDSSSDNESYSDNDDNSDNDDILNYNILLGPTNINTHTIRRPDLSLNVDNLDTLLEIDSMHNTMIEEQYNSMHERVFENIMQRYVFGNFLLDSQHNSNILSRNELDRSNTIQLNDISTNQFRNRTPGAPYRPTTQLPYGPSSFTYYPLSYNLNDSYENIVNSTLYQKK